MSEAAAAATAVGAPAGGSAAAPEASAPTGITPDARGGSGVMPDPAPGAAPAGGDWMSSLSADNANIVQAKGWKSVDEMAESYRNLEKLVGRRQEGTLTMPAPDASPEDVAKFWQQLGAPEDKSGYKFEVPENITGMDKDLIDWFADVAHQNHLPTEAANNVHKAYAQKIAEINTAQMQARDQKIASWNEQLEQTYGNAYDEKIGMARRAIGALAGEHAEEMTAYLERTGLGSYPPFVDMLVKTAEMMTEDSLAAYAPRNGAGARTPTEIKSDIDKLTGSGLSYDQQRKLPYWDGSHPEHKAAVDRVQKLHEAMTPDSMKPVNSGSMLRVG